MNQLRNIFVSILLVNLFAIGSLFAQEREALATHRMHEMQTWREMIERQQSHINDSTIDVKFYHLDIEIGIQSPYISGNVMCRFEPENVAIDQLFLDLSGALTVTEISSPCESFTQSDNKIWIQLDQFYQPGDVIDLTINYTGTPIMPGGYKGLRYETHGNDEPIIATLSTPYLAHYWYPCKDGPEDKADSVYIDITIDDVVVNGLDMIAISNGVLEETVTSGGKKTFKWRHRYPIVTYYIMAAISNYDVIQQQFDDGEGVVFPLDYYVFSEDYSEQESGVEDIPAAIQFFSSIFGTYPFATEKFGMTQLGYYGAIENQTNVIQNTMEPNWFMISVHELAHMWFADMITCETWHHGWLNEGFATYSEALWTEHQSGINAYHNYMNGMQYFDGGTVYLQDTDDPFEIFIPIIYNKGAWVLHMLRGVVGDSLFFESLSNYALDTNFMYMSATTEQLQEVFELSCETDLDYFFDQWIYDEYFPIYTYNYIQEENGNLFVMIYQSQEELLDRRPVFEMPVPIWIGFEDGTDTTITVWNDKQLQEFEFLLEKEVSWVEIDPEKWILRITNFESGLPVSLSEITEDSPVHTFPNPVEDYIYFEFSKDIDPSGRLSIYDISGKTIQEENIVSKRQQIDLSGLKPGVYFYRLFNDKNNYISCGKIIKK